MERNVKKGLTNPQPLLYNKDTNKRGDKKMTIKDLYNWAVENGVENFEIQIQYRDGGGYYCGSDSCEQDNIEIDTLHNEVIL